MMTGTVPAAPRYKGMVTADGRLWVDSAGVSNHATIFEGSVVETEEVPAKLRLASGARVWLDVASRANVFQDHLLLQKGRAQLDAGSAFRIEARTLRVALAAPESQVGTLNGQALVRNGQDVMVARVDFGRPVDLRPDSSGGSLATGCVSKLAKSFVLQDEVSGVPVELHGKNLNAYLGKRIQVTGKAAEMLTSGTAEQEIQASTIKVLGMGCPASLAVSTGTAAEGSRERGAPISAGTASVASGTSAGISLSAAVLGGTAVAASSAAVAHVVAAKKKKPPISHGR